MITTHTNCNDRDSMALKYLAGEKVRSILRKPVHLWNIALPMNQAFRSIPCWSAMCCLGMMLDEEERNDLVVVFSSLS